MWPTNGSIMERNVPSSLLYFLINLWSRFSVQEIRQCRLVFFRLFDRLSHSGMATPRFTRNQMVFTSFMSHRIGLPLLVCIRLLRLAYFGLRYQMEDKAKQWFHREIRIADQTGLKALQTRFTLGDLSRIIVRWQLLTQRFEADEKFIVGLNQSTEQLHHIRCFVRFRFGNVRWFGRRVLVFVRLRRFRLLGIEEIVDEQLRDDQGTGDGEKEYWLNRSRIIGKRRCWIARMIRRPSLLFGSSVASKWKALIIAEIVRVRHRFCTNINVRFVAFSCRKKECLTNNGRWTRLFENQGGSPWGGNLDRTSVAAGIDGDIAMRILGEKDRWPNVLIHRDNDRRHINIHLDPHRCPEPWPVLCNCSIDLIGIPRVQLHQLFEISGGTRLRWTEQGLDKFDQFDALTTADWFYRRESAMTTNTSPRARRHEWPNSGGLWESNRSSRSHPIFSSSSKEHFDELVERRSNTIVRRWPCSMVDDWAAAEDRMREKAELILQWFGNTRFEQNTLDLTWSIVISIVDGNEHRTTSSIETTDSPNDAISTNGRSTSDGHLHSSPRANREQMKMKDINQIWSNRLTSNHLQIDGEEKLRISQLTKFLLWPTNKHSERPHLSFEKRCSWREIREKERVEGDRHVHDGHSMRRRREAMRAVQRSTVELFRGNPPGIEFTARERFRLKRLISSIPRLTIFKSCQGQIRSILEAMKGMVRAFFQRRPSLSPSLFDRHTYDRREYSNSISKQLFGQAKRNVSFPLFESYLPSCNGRAKNFLG